MHINNLYYLKKINLFIEKPLDSNLEKAHILKQLKKKFNLKILVTYPFRFSEHANRLKQRIKTKKFGKVL